MIWLLAKDYVLSSNTPTHARIRNTKSFIQSVSTKMNCRLITANKRVKQAIDIGFLIADGDQLIITGKDKLIDIAFTKQTRAFDSKQSSFKPEFIFSEDRQYSIKFSDLIDPKDKNKTRAMLYSLVAVHLSNKYVSRETHAKLLNVSRNTIIKLSNNSDITTHSMWLLINPLSLLVSPDCTKEEALNAIFDAEKLYRRGFSTRGRKIFQRKRTENGTALGIQLPNTYTSERILKEVPVKFGTLAVLPWPGKRPPVCGQQGAHSMCKESPLDCRKSFVPSRELTGVVTLPGSLIGRYLGTLIEILKNVDCQSAILDATGAHGVTESIMPQVWRDHIKRNDTLGVVGI